MSAQLKPCPFCGKPGQIAKTEWGSFAAGCLTENCPAENGAYDFVTAESAAAHWNTRATPSQRLDAATVERCAQVADAFRAQADNLAQRHGMTDERVISSLAGEEVAARIRALATEPHQHGGKGA